jgi:hypothetical protein
MKSRSEKTKAERSKLHNQYDPKICVIKPEGKKAEKTKAP